MGVDNDASPPREFDDFEAGIEAMVQHLFTRDPNDEVRKLPPLIYFTFVKAFSANFPLEMDDRPNRQSTPRIRHSGAPSARYIQNVRYALHDQHNG